MPNTQKLISASQLSPSRFVIQFAEMMISITGSCIVDAPSGMGRNALYLAEMGAKVHCIDCDESQLEKLREYSEQLGLQKRVTMQKLDLKKAAKDIAYKKPKGFINIDWPEPSLLETFDDLLQRGGFLLVETFSNRGENWRSLPTAGWYKKKLQENYDFKFYEERKAGPKAENAVTLKLIAFKK
jgi:tRNA A58 N-methylase Trm61